MLSEAQRGEQPLPSVIAQMYNFLIRFKKYFKIDTELAISVLFYIFLNRINLFRKLGSVVFCIWVLRRSSVTQNPATMLRQAIRFVFSKFSYY